MPLPATFWAKHTIIMQTSKADGNKEPTTKGYNFARQAATQKYHPGLHNCKQAKPERVLSTLLWFCYRYLHAVLQHT